MNFPSPRDWLFSLKTFIAAMVALYLALAFELPRPYWAMATVYIVSNPFLGATRSKALYRVIGTVVGAIVAILIVPPFVEAPYFFSVIVALWTGTLLYLALNDRTARSYVFMLAGYTLPLIAFSGGNGPNYCFRHRDRTDGRDHSHFISIQSAYEADFLVFMNANMGGVAACCSRLSGHG